MRWMWIDRVVSLEPRQRLVAIKNVSLAEEHLHDHFAADRKSGLAAMPIMPASLILEGMAQAGGILVGHAENFALNVILAKINKAIIDEDATPGCTLRYTAVVERIDEIGASVRGTIELLDMAKIAEGFRTIGATEMMFSHLDNNAGGGGQAGADFPEYNFVFGEGFKTLLRTSGIR